MGLKGSLGRKVQRARLKRALSQERKRSENAQKRVFEIKKENERIAALKEKQKLQKLKRRRQNLERVTGTGIRGTLARTERVRKKIASHQVSFSRRASKQRLAAFDTAGLVAPARAKKVIKIKKPKRRRRKMNTGVTLTLR
jgi:hypothetical protein